MAKGQVRSNKEAKKPKKEKPKVIAAAAPVIKIGANADQKEISLFGGRIVIPGAPRPARNNRFIPRLGTDRSQ